MEDRRFIIPLYIRDNEYNEEKNLTITIPNPRYSETPSQSINKARIQAFISAYRQVLVNGRREEVEGEALVVIRLRSNPYYMLYTKTEINMA